jgi:hypothetical protein
VKSDAWCESFVEQHTRKVISNGASDLSTDSGLFDKILAFFDSKIEEVRSAAAFAAGE